MSHVLDNPPQPGTTTWRHTITASKIPAILGISPFTSPYALWHLMHGDIHDTHEDTDQFAWGHIAEESLVSWWKRAHPGWRTNRGEITYTNPDLPFPNLATLDRRAVRGRRYHIIECKTVRDMSTWGPEGTPDSAPIHYVAQVTAQMGISGIHEASLVALGNGTPEIHPVPWDEDLWQLIQQRCHTWHQSLIDGTPPPLDDTVATYDAIRGLHPDIDKNTVVQLPADLAESYLAAVRAAKHAKTVEQMQKNQVMDAMGTAHKAMLGDTPIASRRLSRGKPALYANTKATI